MAGMDNPGPEWQEWFSFPGDWGCALTIVGFVLFLVAVVISWQVFFN
jgi:hypothetical protein